MATRQLIRRALPWLAAWLAAQVLLALAVRLAARWWNRGDESSPRIRRVCSLGGTRLRPTSPELSALHVAFAMGGAEIDLTGMGQPVSAVELTANGFMGGLAVRVPPGWRVWWSFRGVGGIGADHGLQRTHDEHEADLRVRARVLFGGVGIQTPQTTAAGQ